MSKIKHHTHIIVHAGSEWYVPLRLSYCFERLPNNTIVGWANQNAAILPYSHSNVNTHIFYLLLKTY